VEVLEGFRQRSRIFEGERQLKGAQRFQVDRNLELIFRCSVTIINKSALLLLARYNLLKIC
jgi:hypothetical protein